MHKVQPAAAGQVGGLEGGRQLGVARHVGAVEGRVGQRGGGLVAVVVLEVEQVDLPASSRRQGLGYGEA